MKKGTQKLLCLSCIHELMASRSGSKKSVAISEAPQDCMMVWSRLRWSHPETKQLILFWEVSCLSEFYWIIPTRGSLHFKKGAWKIQQTFTRYLVSTDPTKISKKLVTSAPLTFKTTRWLQYHRPEPLVTWQGYCKFVSTFSLDRNNKNQQAFKSFQCVDHIDYITTY